MPWTITREFRFLCQLLLLTFCFSLFQPANLGTPWSLELRIFMTSSGGLAVTSHLFSVEFGPPSVYGSLEQTPEADPSDPFVAGKAAELGRNPQQIFDFVRGDIGYEVYAGSLRGARGALWSQAGNALDKASLMIALLRASNIPARYVQGALSHALAQDLILSMFPNVLRIVGCPPESAERADPTNDAQLLAEAEQHFWVEYDFGGQTIQADPTLGAALGQTFATAQSIFAAVPDDLRHKVSIRLIRELISNFPGSPPDNKTVLQETFTAAELVGKSLSLGHFVETVSPPSLVFAVLTHKYSPYLIVGQSDGDISDDPLIRGEDYQEYLTNFPLGSQILTGVFLEMDLMGPGGKVETLERRPIVDKIGFAARNSGGSVSLGGDAANRAALSPLDITTIRVGTSRPDPTIISTLATEAEELQAPLQHLSQLLDGVDVNSLQPAEQDLAAQLLATNRKALLVSTHLSAVLFADLSAQVIRQFADTSLIKAYFNQPRITLVSSKIRRENETASIGFEMNLWSNRIKGVPFPGQVSHVLAAFYTAQGILESATEHEIMSAIFGAPNITGGKGVSAAAVFAAAESQGVDLIILGPGNAERTESLLISTEAKIRISQAVAQGKFVVVPSRNIQIGTTQTVSWFEHDPVTGFTRDVSENGGHQFLFAYTGRAVDAANVLLLFNDVFSITFTVIGVLTEVLIHATDISRDSKALARLAYSTGSGITFALRLALKRLGATSFLSLNPLLFGLSAFGIVLAIAGGLLFLVRQFDPPVGEFLANLAGEIPPEAFAGLIQIVPDDLLTIPLEERELPTAFRVQIHNPGATTDTFTIAITDVPDGFRAQSSVPSLTLPAGATGEVGICLFPDNGLEAPGTPAPFTVKVTSITNSSVTATTTEPFTVPQVPAVALSADPTFVNATPGSSAPTTLTITNIGNVSLDNITFSIDVPSNLTVNGLASPVSLGVGESTAQPLTLSVGGGAPLNELLTATITASFASSATTATITVQVVATAAHSAAQAAQKATAIGRPELGATLSQLSLTMTDLSADPDDPALRSRVIALLDSILAQFNAPAFTPFIDDLTAARNALSTANTVGEVQSALTDVSGVLTALCGVLEGQEAFPFEIALNPNSVVALPQIPTQFSLFLKNTGAQTTTYNISLGLLPPGITSELSRTSVTLNPDEFIPSLQTGEVVVTLTQPAQELTAFEFTVTASVASSPGVSRTATGVFTARTELVEVTEVEVNPSFGDPGDQINIAARLFNAVNQTRRFKVFYEVLDPLGATMFTSTPQEVELTVLSSLDTVALGTLDTTGFTLGMHIVKVIVTDLNDAPIPGAEGRANLLIGSPVVADLFVEQTLLPPCDATLTTTLTLNSLVALPPADIDILDVVDTGTATSVVLKKEQNLAYVCGTENITIVDISDPRDLQTVGTFAEDIASFWSTCALLNDELVVAHHTGVGGLKTLVDLYSLTDPLQPVFIRRASTGFVFLSGMFARGTSAFVSTQGIGFIGGAPNDLFGDFLSFDLSTGSSALTDRLGTAGAPKGGNYMVTQGAAISDGVALVPTSTAAGSLTSFNGSGCLAVVDISDPANLSIVDVNPTPLANPDCELLFPETGQLMGVAVQGNTALVIGSSGPRRMGGPFDFLGSLVLITLDVSNPANPVVLQSLTTALPAPGILTHPAAIGNNMFAVNGGTVDDGAGNDIPAILLIDASDPADIKTTLVKIPTGVNDLFGKDGVLYATGSDGLTVFDLGSVKSGSAEVAVQIPSGVSVNSFNVQPTQVIPGAEFDTLLWEGLGLNSTLTWETVLTNLQSGEVREVVRQATVDFTLPTGEMGQIALAPIVVAGEQILSVTPDTRTVQRGEDAVYTIQVKNPSPADVTYNLSVQGAPQDWVDLNPTVTAPANGTVEVNLALRPDPSAPNGEYGFVITAADTCATGFVHASLILEGEPVGDNEPPDVGEDVESVAHGCTLDLTPGQAQVGQTTSAEFTVRVINTGNAPDIISLSVGLPNGFTGDLAQTVVHLSPGLNNFRDISLRITPPQGTAGNHLFSVTASANAAVCDQVSGSLDVVRQGVDVSLNPSSGLPGGAFTLNITNTGQESDAFEVATAGPLAPFVSLSESTVNLGAGATTTVTMIVDAIDFAFPGSLPLIGVATSQTNPAVTDADTALITIVETRGISAEFAPNVLALTSPGETETLLVVRNLGNLENAYSASITGINGPLTAALTGLDGQPTQEIALFRLPGASTGAFLLNVELIEPGQGSVVVTITSLTDPTLTATATAFVNAEAQALDHFMCYKTRPTRGSICAEDALANAGGVCENEADCGGRDEGDDETDFCRPNKFPRNLQVFLRDQLEDKAFHVPKPLSLCLPASKNNEGINDLLTHLQNYRIREVKKSCTMTAPARPLAACMTEEDCGGTSQGSLPTEFCQRTPKHEKQTNIRIDNQFGTIFVDTKKPDQLFVPTAKDPVAPIAPLDPSSHDVDHFKCYTVKLKNKVCEDDPGVKCKTDADCANAGLAGGCNFGFPKNLQVTVTDQFTDPAKLYDVLRPNRLCTPVDKNEEGVKNPEASLMCYKVQLINKICTPAALLNVGGQCRREEDCGGSKGQTAFCQRQPKHESARGVHTNNQFGPDLLDTLREDELCVPSSDILQ